MVSASTAAPGSERIGHQSSKSSGHPATGSSALDLDLLATSAPRTLLLFDEQRLKVMVFRQEADA